MRRGVVWIVVGLAGLYLAIAAFLYSVQRSFLYFPDTRRPDVAAAGIASLKAIELVTSDGVRLLAWYLPPAQGRPVVLYFHGNAGNLEDRIVWLTEFAKAGLGLLIPEYRGYGGNKGEPTEDGLHADATAAMAFLRAQGFGREQIVVFGESLGTGVATRLAVEQPVAALVLESPFTSISAVAARRFFLLPVGLLLKDKYDSLSRIPQLRAPILIIQGERDEVVLPALGRKLFDAAPEPKEIWSAPQGEHVGLLKFGAADVVVDFLRRHVPSLDEAPEESDE